MGLPKVMHPARYLASIKRDDVKANIKTLWCQPYDADPIVEPDLVGMTHGQVILYRQLQQAIKGDGTSVDRLLDRMIGKPDQVNKNLNVSQTYKEFLEEVARDEGIIDVDGNVIEAQYSGESEPEIR